MNAHEQRIREFAYQIWESEGCPTGHEYRHWEMACKLAEAQNSVFDQEKVTSQIKSVIAPDEPFDPNPRPEVDIEPPKPEIPGTPQQPPGPNTTPDIAPTEPPADPIAPVEPPPHISPTPEPPHIAPGISPTPTPIQPTDPVQPGNPAQPVQPRATKKAATGKRATKTAASEITAEKTPAKPRKSRSAKPQDILTL